jgi:DNA-binding transcriptional regulator YiaG
MMNRHREPIPIPTLDDSLSRVKRLAEDIKLILEKEGIKRSQLARALGVSRVEVWHWEKGNRMPRDPLITICLLSWGDKLREA